MLSQTMLVCLSADFPMSAEGILSTETALTLCVRLRFGGVVVNNAPQTYRHTMQHGFVHYYIAKTETGVFTTMYMVTGGTIFFKT